MGVLRFLLALAVIAAHTAPLPFIRPVGAAVSVQAFFVISGFYMALILNEKYVSTKSTYTLFLQSRLLRLWPSYVVVLLASLLIQIVWPATRPDNVTSGGLGIWLQHSGQMSPSAIFALAGANLFIVGQDALMYAAVHVREGTLYLTANFVKEPLAAYRFLFVPQAWSLGIELLFYSIAPFLVRRRVGTIVGVAAGSFLLRAALMHAGYRDDPWSYRFFPTELGFFLLGALGYRYYRHVAARLSDSSRAAYCTVGVCVAFILFYEAVPIPGKRLLFLLVIAAAIPFVFHLSRKNELDRTIGELSYPMYITHLLVAHVLEASHIQGGLTTVAITIIVSYALLVSVERTINRYRERLYRTRSASEPGDFAPRAISVR
jgi:peptidoglycan/LPS O-acetylase OafA/YrhL